MVMSLSMLESQQSAISLSPYNGPCSCDSWLLLVICRMHLKYWCSQVQAATCKAQAIISQAETGGDRCIARAQEEAILAAAAIPSSPPEGAAQA